MQSWFLFLFFFLFCIRRKLKQRITVNTSGGMRALKHGWTSNNCANLLLPLTLGYTDIKSPVYLTLELSFSYYLSQAMMQRDEELAKEIQVLKQKHDEVEQLARVRGPVGFSRFKDGHATEDGNGKPT